jgi:hypothetical protein
MDQFEKFIKNVAWKFPKGYPDMNNSKDRAMLFEMVRNIITEDMLTESDAEEGIDIIKKETGLEDDKFIKVSSSIYKILVPRSERYKYVTKLNDLDGFEYDPNMAGSSIGGIKYKGAKFLFKPSGAQGRASAGTENEDIIANELNNLLADGPKDVLFVAPNKSYLTKNVKEVTTVGYDVAGGKKADIVLKGTRDYPVSIKKDNAGFWESSDSRYKDVVAKLSEKIKKGDFAPELVFKPFVDKLGYEKKGINTMYNDVTNEPVTGVIVTNLPSKDEESIIFGSDNAVVVYRTYSPNDFELDGNTIKVKVSKIIEDLADVEEFNLEPVLNIRHDSTRTATGGLRATVQPEKVLYKDGQLTGNKVEIPYNKIMS